MLVSVVVIGKEHGKEVAEWVRRSHDKISLRKEEAWSTLLENGINDLLKYYKYDKKILQEAVIGKSAGIKENIESLFIKIKQGKSINICTVGSSVTAGHDGFGLTAWPAVLERRLRSFGLNVTVNNQAVGGRNPYPASLCLKNICGLHVDIVLREWQYWSLEDGLSQYGDDVVATPQTAAAHFVERASELSDDHNALVGFVFFDTEKNIGHVPRILIDDYIPKKNVFGDRGVVIFSSFSHAFNHLRQIAPKKRKNKDGKKDCTSLNVGECPLVPYPDGYHSEPLFDVPWKHSSHPSKLFINWHPGSLGHEIVGNQVAYFLGTQVLSLAFNFAPTIKSTITPKAHPAFQSIEQKYALMSANVFCALSTLPSFGSSVGDLINNSTTGQTKWIEEATPFSKRKTMHCQSDNMKQCYNEHNFYDLKCYNLMRPCSYRDSKRGFTGTAAHGPLSIHIPFQSDHQCIVLISEPGYEWSKPVLMANFFHEFSIKINNNQPCNYNDCFTVLQERGGYIQTLRIDLSQQFSPCRPTTISISITPVPSLFTFSNQSTSDLQPKNPPICALAKNGRCEPHGTWRRYEIRCHKHDDDSCSVKRGEQKNRRPPELVSTFIESIIYF